MWKKCACTSLPRIYPLERKAIDASGRLGSLYDASTDNLLDECSVKPSKTKPLNQRCITRIFSGVQSNEEARFLKEIGFDDALRQSILLQMVIPSGVCRLIDYSRPINHNTRLLYYSYRSKIDELHVEAGKTAQIVTPPQGPTFATHMITKILWGIEVLCVIQIPTNQPINIVDELLRRICHQIQNNIIPIQLNDNDRHLISQLTDTIVYGTETCINDLNISILTILDRIQDWQNNTNLHQPLEYTLQPLRWLYNNIQFPVLCNWPHQIDTQLERIEPLLIRIKTDIKNIREILGHLPANFSSQTIDYQLEDIHRRFDFLLTKRQQFQEHLQKALIDIRRHRVKSKIIDDVISDLSYTYLHIIEMKSFHIHSQRLVMKITLIEKLRNDRIEYINLFDIRSDGKILTTIEDIAAALKHSLSNEKDSVILWYSCDRLKREQADKWGQIYQQLISERQQATQTIKLIYADFSQCQKRLEDFIIETVPKTDIPKIPNDPIIEISSQPQPTISDLPSPSPPPPHSTTEINVLLLGETGVGKSTFINAFANYLKFETLQQAEQGELMVLIPASFLITVGDQFDVFTVKFGTIDPNESDEHQGQSVTRQCRSYTFDLNNTLRLRLIDTPGIGDIRGTPQDIKHMNHILTYVNNLSHLNAICLFLKPNSSAMNIFRLCISQLLTYLTPVAYDNIIFCFTNTRANLYTPGDTGPLLRNILHDEQLDDISFQRENTFCFDNESFRYLAARKCDVDFKDHQKEECKISWSTSVTELLRLLNFIQKTKSYCLEEWISPRKAALDICLLARPLMETLRLIIYNTIISENQLNDNRMELNSTPVAIDICTHCAKMNIVGIGPFWITQYQPVITEDNTTRHRLCVSDGKNFLIEALVQHEFVAQSADLKGEQWQSSFHAFLLKSDRLLHYLRQQESLVKDDPFQPILEQFLEEERDIFQNHNINSNMNRRFNEVLLSIKQLRQEHSQQLSEAKERLPLSEAYKIINELMAIPTVKRQIDNIKRSREIKMAAHDYRIPPSFIKNRAISNGLILDYYLPGYDNLVSYSI